MKLKNKMLYHSLQNKLFFIIKRQRRDRMMDIEDIIISTEDCIPPKNSCEFVEGNATKDIEIDKNIKFCEIRTDIEVRKLRTVRLWVK
jgi:hypothetical protein